MRSTIDTRLSRLEAYQPRKGRTHTMIVVKGEYDPDVELQKRGLVLGPDDDVMWVELVPVYPSDRPPWNEGRHTESRSAG